MNFSERLPIEQMVDIFNDNVAFSSLSLKEAGKIEANFWLVFINWYTSFSSNHFIYNEIYVIKSRQTF